MTNNKKYKIYKPWSKLVKRVDSIDEVMAWVYDNYPNLPQHYYDGVRSVDSMVDDGTILCWGGVKVKKGESEMTSYTSF